MNTYRAPVSTPISRTERRPFVDPSPCQCGVMFIPCSVILEESSFGKRCNRIVNAVRSKF